MSEECIKISKYIWDELVPSHGRADSLQGELLRLITKIQKEISKNGSVGWSLDYEKYCNFIKDNLTNSEYLNKLEKENLISAIGEIRILGRENYNKNYNLEIITPYDKKYNELFDIIRISICLLHKRANKILYYEIKKESF